MKNSWMIWTKLSLFNIKIASFGHKARIEWRVAEINWKVRCAWQKKKGL